jgi:hypothetical protein
MFKSWKKFEGADQITILMLGVFCLVAVIGLFVIR